MKEILRSSQSKRLACNALYRNKQESHFVSNPVILNNQDILVIEIN